MYIPLKIFLFVFGTFWTAENTEWRSFTSKEGGFSVLIPGEFVREHKVIKTDIGDLPHISYVYQDTLGHSKNELYVISYSDYPKNTFHKDSMDLIDELLEVSVDQKNKNLKGQITYNHKIKVEGYPGRIFRINYNNGKIVMKSKMFLVKDRFYSIQIYTLYKHSLNFNIDKFFNSFRLIRIAP